MKKITIKYLLCSGWIFFMSQPVYAELPLRKMQKKYFDTFETGLGPVGQCSSRLDNNIGIWLSNDLFAMTATQPVSDAIENCRQRTMLINTKEKTARVLVESGSLVCWNEARQIASLKALGSEEMNSPTYRFMHLDAQGNTGPLEKEPTISPHHCRVDTPLPKGMLVTHLREGDGYILLSAPHEKYDDEKSAILMRPGKSPVTLHASVAEIHHRFIYLPHLGKYLLNTFDSKGNSATDRHLASLTWKRPYALAPYRLMGLEGTIEMIPYPYILSEYGLDDRRFSMLLPTKAGVLIHSGWRLFLLQGESIVQFWPQPSLFGLEKKEYIRGIKLSPDGCKIAFRHFPNYRYSTVQPVAIVNLCKEK